MILFGSKDNDMLINPIEYVIIYSHIRKNDAILKKIAYKFPIKYLKNATGLNQIY